MDNQLSHHGVPGMKWGVRQANRGLGIVRNRKKVAEARVTRGKRNSARVGASGKLRALGAAYATSVARDFVSTVGGGLLMNIAPPQYAKGIAFATNTLNLAAKAVLVADVVSIANVQESKKR